MHIFRTCAREHQVATVLVAHVSQRLAEHLSLHRFMALGKQVKLCANDSYWQVRLLHLRYFVLNFRHHWDLLPIVNKPRVDLLEHL